MNSDNVVSAGGGKEFPKPSTGLVQAVCYAVWNIGPQRVEYQGEEKILNKTIIAWEIDESIPDGNGEYSGKRFVVSKKYTASLNDKATLRKDLEQWRGKTFTPDELKGFDLDTLIGVNCQLNLVANVVGDKTYINVGNIVPIGKVAVKMAPENPHYPAPKWVQKLIDGQVAAKDAHTVKSDAPEQAETVDNKEEEIEIPF